MKIYLQQIGLAFDFDNRPVNVSIFFKERRFSKMPIKISFARGI